MQEGNVYSFAGFPLTLGATSLSIAERLNFKEVVMYQKNVFETAL